MASYGNLSSWVYDVEKGLAPPSEVDFFAEHVSQYPGPALEAMCGSGRLMIPLRRRGLEIHGVDNSSAMLRRLVENSRRAGVPGPVYFDQSVAELKLPRRYAVIFIALGSLQLLSREDADRALEKLRAHLSPGGVFILDSFVPWELIARAGAPHETARTVPAGERQIRVVSKITVFPEARRYRQENLYGTEEIEAERLDVQWYYPEEMTEKLTGAGFTDVRVQGVPISAERPRRYLYFAR